MKTAHLAIALGVIAAAATLTSAAASEPHHADDAAPHDPGHHREGDGRRGDVRGAGDGIDPTYAKECGACHLAYPPRMLPAASWRRMLGELDRHFGQNAELDDAVRSRLEGWLLARAGKPRQEGGGAPQRITGLSWFVKEHREVPAEVLARPAIRSPANCAACHQGAARWAFEDDRVRIPR